MQDTLRSHNFTLNYLFDESLYHCDDCDWFMRAREMGISIQVHQEVTYFYRRHDQNMTNDMEMWFKFALRMLKQSLDRRRQQGNRLVKQLPKLSDSTIKPV